MKNLTNFSQNNSNSIPSGFFNLLNMKNDIEDPNQNFIYKNMRKIQIQQSKINRSRKSIKNYGGNKRIKKIQN